MVGGRGGEGTPEGGTFISDFRGFCHIRNGVQPYKMWHLIYISFEKYRCKTLQKRDVLVSTAHSSRSFFTLFGLLGHGARDQSSLGKSKGIQAPYVYGDIPGAYQKNE